MPPGNSQVPPLLLYHLVSGYTIQLWEWLSQFDDEVRWVWPLPKGSLVKWNFLLSRYGGLALQGALLYQYVDIQHHDYSSVWCRFWFAMRLMAPSIIGCLVQLTLLNRIFALYSRETWIKRFIVFLYTLQVVAMFTIWITVVQAPMAYGPRCQLRAPLERWPFIVAGWSPVALDCVLVILTLFKVIPLFHIPNAASVLRIVVRDGLWAFVLVTVATAATQLFLFSGDWLSRSASINWLVTIFTFVPTRLILNIFRFREKAQSKQAGTTGQFASTEAQESLTNVIPLSLGVFTQYRGGNSTHNNA